MIKGGTERDERKGEAKMRAVWREMGEWQERKIRGVKERKKERERGPGKRKDGMLMR